MNTLVIDCDGASAYANGSATSAPTKAILVADLVRRWFVYAERVHIGWVNFLGSPWAQQNEAPQLDWTRDEVVKIQAAANDALMRDNTELLERAKSAERAVARLRAELAATRNVTGPAEPPQGAACPGEIPKSELTFNPIVVSGSREIDRLQRIIERLRRERDEAKQESVASQTLWHAVSNECEGLWADVRMAEESYNALRKRVKDLLS